MLKVNISSMYSNSWLLNRPIRKQSQSQTPLFHTYSNSLLTNDKERDTNDDSRILLKVDWLTKKLSSKQHLNQTLDYSRFSRNSNMKSTKVRQKQRYLSNQEGDLSELKLKKSQYEANNQTQIQSLEEKAIVLSERIKQIQQYAKNHNSQISIEIQNLSKIIRQINERSTSFGTVKKQFKIYSDLFNNDLKEKYQTQPKRPNSRLYTGSSALKDTSLLLSFKKNMEQDDGYVTFKYSQQSQNRQPNDTLVQGWQSIQRQSKSRVCKKFQTKPPSKGIKNDHADDPEQKYFDIMQQEIVYHLNQRKIALVTDYDESTKVLSKFEIVLEKIVQEIAYQKVQREQFWRDIQEYSSALITEITAAVIHLKKNTLQIQDETTQNLQEIEADVMQKLSLQKSQRKLQQRMMITMMTDVVNFFK